MFEKNTFCLALFSFSFVQLPLRNGWWILLLHAVRHWDYIVPGHAE